MLEIPKGDIDGSQVVKSNVDIKILQDYYHEKDTML
jgi:hypothetical protein